MGSEANGLAALSCCPRTSAADGHRRDPDRRVDGAVLLADSRCAAFRDRNGSTELVQRVGEQNVRSDEIVVPLEIWARWRIPGDVPGSPDDGNTNPATCITSWQRQLLRTRSPFGATAARGRQCRR
jgi:hypothetical protein